MRNEVRGSINVSIFVLTAGFWTFFLHTAVGLYFFLLFITLLSNTVIFFCFFCLCKEFPIVSLAVVIGIDAGTAHFLPTQLNLYTFAFAKLVISSGRARHISCCFLDISLSFQ